MPDDLIESKILVPDKPHDYEVIVDEFRLK